MTKPSRPRANSAPVLEIDAMDVMEWQHGQRTPQASDANLAALVRQSAKHESAPVVAEPRKAPLVARARLTNAPPRRPSDLPGKPPAFPAIATPIPARMPSEAVVTRPQTRSTRTPRAVDVPMSVTGYPIFHGADGSSDRQPALDARSAVVPVATPAVAQLPLQPPAPSAPVPMGTQPQAPLAPTPVPAGTQPVAPAVVAPVPTGTQPMVPSAWAAQAPSPYPVMARSPSPDPFALADHQTSSPDLRAPSELREARPPRAHRRLFWLLGAAAAAAGVLAAVVLVGGPADAPPAAPGPAVAAADPAPAAPTPSSSPSVPSVPSVPTRVASAPAAAPPPIVPIAHPPDAAPHPAIAVVAPSAPRPAVHATPRPGRRVAAKKIVVDYQSRRNEAPVPSLVAQASEDPAIARARTAYLTGNDKLFAGDAPSAIVSYREALDLYPGYVGGFRGLGLAYAQLGETQKAIEALKSYVAAAPTAKDASLIKKRITRLLGK